MSSWPQPPRGMGKVLGRGSNPTHTGMLPSLERMGETSRAPRRTIPVATATDVHSWNAAGEDVAGRGRGGPSIVKKAGRLVEVNAAIGEPVDVDLFIDLYRCPPGASVYELIRTFTLLAGADVDRWGLDLRVRNGDRLATEFRTDTPATTGSDLVVKAITQ